MKKRVPLFATSVAVFTTLLTMTIPLRAQWVQTNGPYGGTVACLAYSGTNLFVGTSGGVWRRPMSEMITAVEMSADNIPAHVGLEQNYPNPFNPATTISFTFPSRSYVSLKVYDVVGREVSILLSEELAGGTYTQKWDASGLSSGIYFYRLQVTPLRDFPPAVSGSFTETKKLVLLR